MNASHCLKIAACVSVCVCSLAATACDDLVIKNAWIREPPPIARVAAGYMEIANTGGEARTVHQVESACCEHLMMHDSVSDGDNVRMSHLDRLTVQPGESIQFLPRGRHLMLMAPAQPLVDGDSVEIDFRCAVGEPVRATFDIIKMR